MADLEGLLARCEVLSRETVKLAEQGKKILVVTHVDADGLASGSIVFASLMRRGANVALRSVPDLDPRRIKELEAEKYDFYIFTDLASALVSELELAFDGRFLVIDHHQLAEEDLAKPSVMNAWQYGYDGGKEACSSTMAYMFASVIDQECRDLSYLAVVGALADRQDGGQGRSLTGLNRKAVEEAQAAGLLTVSNDLTFTGRQTRPVHEAVALTSAPYLPGISGNKDAVLATLLQAGMNLKDGARWRTLSELTGEEKMKLTEVIAGVIGASGGATDALAGLVGEVYSLEYEDSFTPLRDAREFGTLLNACGRMGAAGVGMSICLGDRGEALKAAMKTLSEYRLSISNAVRGLMGESSRVEQHGTLVLAKASGLVDEKLLGPVTSIITSSPAFKDKVVVAMTDSGETEVKVSSRVGDSYVGSVNLGIVMREAAEAVNGVGGGHSMAAGAKIPSSAIAAFSKLVLEKVGT
ncbi:MAG: DHH family phosphoesterase [Nitrososphaerales archaeon]|nr:DHH family phosphoesterase [Nitrososphaerales archaeon]